MIFSILSFVFPTFDWFTGLVGLMSAVGTVLVSYFYAKKKNKTDSFQSIIEANEKFRDEVRKDLNGCKKELEFYKNAVQKLEKDIVENEHQVIKLKNEILDYKEKILELTSKIMKYEHQISDLKTQLDECQKENQQGN